MKIIRYKPKNQYLLEYLENLIEIIKRDEIDNFMICYKDKKSREMCTGYFNLDMGQKMECVGHIQADIMDQMVAVNIDKYIEVIEI